jgi:GTP pyrophosphokinase
MYQSLHTAVVGPEGRTLEVQIRTPEMHKVAEYGVAAHWRYNEQAKRDPQFEAKVAWLRQITEWREDVTDAGEFLASVQSDVFQDRVYVRTPKGKIIDLPAGATPIDFAYRIHTDIGHRCKGAKVDGRLVPLDYQLRSGERVEILTASRGGPSHDWLNPNLGFVKTAQAREKIRQWFKKQKREENIAQGREILDKELMRLDLHRLFQAIIRILDYDKPNRPSDDDFIVQQRRLKEFEQLGFDTPRGEELLHFFQKYEHLDDLYFAIGHGSITPQHIIARLEQPQEATERLEVVLPTPIPVGITVRGTGGFLTSLARCCNPLPGDPIIGYVTRGRGVTIHKRDCRNLARKGITERLIEVDWGATAEHTFPVLVRIAAFDRAGLLRDVSNVVANEGVNLSEARVSTNKQDHTAIITATLEVTSISQLSRLLARIGRLPNVVEARRYTGA